MKWIVAKTNSPTSHFETITEAITQANDFDEIHIYSGHYFKKLIINKNKKLLDLELYVFIMIVIIWTM